MRSIFVCTFIVILETGCETASPPRVPIQKIPDVREDAGLVLVMRFGLGIRMTTGSLPIYVDNKEVFAVKDWSYTYFWVTPGPHTFKAEWSPVDKVRLAGNKFDTSTLDLEIEAGKAYFINYKIVSDATAPPSPVESINPFAKSKIISSGLILETHESGRSNLSYCTFQENHWR